MDTNFYSSRICCIVSSRTFWVRRATSAQKNGYKFLLITDFFPISAHHRPSGFGVRHPHQPPPLSAEAVLNVLSTKWDGMEKVLIRRITYRLQVYATGVASTKTYMEIGTHGFCILIIECFKVSLIVVNFFVENVFKMIKNTKFQKNIKDFSVWFTHS